MSGIFPGLTLLLLKKISRELHCDSLRHQFATTLPLVMNLSCTFLPHLNFFCYIFRIESHLGKYFSEIFPDVGKLGVWAKCPIFGKCIVGLILQFGVMHNCINRQGIVNRLLLRFSAYVGSDLRSLWQRRLASEITSSNFKYGNRVMDS
jgi:hypothetical protein